MFCLSDCRRYQLERTDTDIQMQSGVEFELRFVVGAARIVCGAGSMKLPGVRPSVRLSVRPTVPSFGRRRTPLRRVCCRAPDSCWRLAASAPALVALHYVAYEIYKALLCKDSQER